MISLWKDFGRVRSRRGDDRMERQDLLSVKSDLSILVGDEVFVVSDEAMKSQKGTFFESGILDKVDDKNFYVTIDSLD